MKGNKRVEEENSLLLGTPDPEDSEESSPPSSTSLFSSCRHESLSPNGNGEPPEASHQKVQFCLDFH